MTRLAHATLAVTLLAAALLPACGGSAPPAEPVPPPTPVAAIDTPPPEFPLALACAGVGGQTLLSVEIGAEGRPTRIDLVRGSGNTELDALASQAVQGWTFRPATRAGPPVPQTIQVPVNFTPPAERPAECFALDAGHPPAS